MLDYTGALTSKSELDGRGDAVAYDVELLSHGCTEIDSKAGGEQVEVDHDVREFMGDGFALRWAHKLDTVPPFAAKFLPFAGKLAKFTHHTREPLWRRPVIEPMECRFASTNVRFAQAIER